MSPVPNQNPKPKAVPSGGGKYVRRAFKQPNGKYRMKWVLKSKVSKPKPKKPKTQKMGVYEGTGATYDAVDSAVKANISGQNAPLWSQIKDAKNQSASNIKASQGILGQTQAQLQSLAATARAGTQGLLSLAGQQAAADSGQRADASAFLNQAFGSNMNPQTQGLLGQQVGLQDTQANAGNVKNAYDVGLSGSLQNDFFNRSQAIAATTQQSFSQAQRDAQARVNAQIRRQIAANQALSPALRRQYMQEDAAFGLQRQQAAMESQAAQAALGFDAAKAEADLDYKYDALQAKVNSSGSNASDKAAAALSKEQRSIANRIYSDIDKKMEKVRTGTGRESQAGPDGKPVTVITKYTMESVFGKNNGPWRDAFKRLVGNGFDQDRAALMATNWFPNSVSGKNYFNIKKMLDNRGVSTSVQKKILGATYRPVQGPPSPPSKQYVDGLFSGSGSGSSKPSGGSIKPKKYIGKKYVSNGFVYTVLGVKKSGNKLVWTTSATKKKPNGLGPLQTKIFTTSAKKIPPFMKGK